MDQTMDAAFAFFLQSNHINTFIISLKNASILVYYIINYAKK